MQAGNHGSEAGERVPQLARNLDPSTLSLTPGEGYLLSRVDGRTPWSLLREIGGLKPSQVDRCLEQWLAEGILVLDGEGDASGPLASASRPKAAASQSGATLDPTLEIPVEAQRRILEFESVLGASYFEILGVSQDAARPAIKQAYFGLSKEFHPDRYFRRRIGSYAPRLERIFKKVVEAYELLSDPAARAELERSLETAPSAAEPAAASERVAPEPAQGLKRRRPHAFSLHRRMVRERRRKAKRLFEAGMAAFASERWLEAAASVRLAIAFDPRNDAYKERFAEVQLKVHAERAAEMIRKGEEALDLRDFPEALQAFEEALHFKPHDPELLHRTARLAWLSAGDLHRAKEYALQACEVCPDVAPYRRTLGQVYKAAGLHANARRELEAALRIDPIDKEAEAELRSLRSRLRAPQWLGGKR